MKSGFHFIQDYDLHPIKSGCTVWPEQSGWALGSCWLFFHRAGSNQLHSPPCLASFWPGLYWPHLFITSVFQSWPRKTFAASARMLKNESACSLFKNGKVIRWWLSWFRWAFTCATIRPFRSLYWRFFIWGLAAGFSLRVCITLLIS